jgi:Succinyl-CoA synthetase, alpha subunit
MAILIDETKRVLVQGITGREGRARTRLMREYGTNVVGGLRQAKADKAFSAFRCLTRHRRRKFVRYYRHLRALSCRRQA